CLTIRYCQTSAQHNVEQEVVNLAEGRAKKIGEVEPCLLEHSLGVAHGFETFSTVVRAHSAWTDAAEREIILRVVQDGVVDEHATGGRPFYDQSLRNLIVPEEI